jgi:hypothetical protein
MTTESDAYECGLYLFLRVITKSCTAEQKKSFDTYLAHYSKEEGFKTIKDAYAFGSFMRSHWAMYQTIPADFEKDYPKSAEMLRQILNKN